MANIRDVARAAGVSIASVSAVVNENGRVGHEARRRVLAAIEVVGYSPNSIARSLRRGRSNLIGVVVTDITNPFSSALVSVFEKAAVARGYSVIICNVDGDEPRVCAILDQLRGQHVAGILLTPGGQGEALISQIERHPRPPLVTFDQKLPGLACDFVGFDNRAAIRLLVDHLAGRGHRRIALITGRLGRWTADERYHGFIEAMTDAGLTVEPELVARSGFEGETAYAVTATLMCAPRPPSAIVAANNVTALGALQCCLDLGLDCPGDVSIVGVDDVPWSGLVRPKLSIASHPVRTMGEVATGWLIERIEAPSVSAPREMILQPEFRPGDSCRDITNVV